MSSRLVFHRLRGLQSNNQADNARPTPKTEKSKSELDAFLLGEAFCLDDETDGHKPHEKEHFGQPFDGLETASEADKTLAVNHRYQQEPVDNSDDDDDDGEPRKDDDNHDGKGNADDVGDGSVEDGGSFDSDAAIERIIQAQLFGTPVSTPQRYTMKDESPSSTRRVRPGRAGHLDKFLAANEQHPSAKQGASPRRVGNDSISCASNTIFSKDVTIASQDLIANMEYMLLRKTGEAGAQGKLWPMDQSVRTAFTSKKSCKSQQRRGVSLERDISRTILQTASLGTHAAHFLVDAPESLFSREETLSILDDLTSMSARQGVCNDSDAVDNNRTSPETDEQSPDDDHHHRDIDANADGDRASAAPSYYSRSMLENPGDLLLHQRSDLVQEKEQETDESKELDKLVLSATSLQISSSTYNAKELSSSINAEDGANQQGSKAENEALTEQLAVPKGRDPLGTTLSASYDVFEGLLTECTSEDQTQPPGFKCAAEASEVGGIANITEDNLVDNGNAEKKNQPTATVEDLHLGTNTEYDAEPDSSPAKRRVSKDDPSGNGIQEFLNNYYVAPNSGEESEPPKNSNNNKSSSFPASVSPSSGSSLFTIENDFDPFALRNSPFQDSVVCQSDGSGTGDDDDWAAFDNSIFGNSVPSHETSPILDKSRSVQHDSPTSVFYASKGKSAESSEVEWEEVNRRFVI